MINTGAEAARTARRMWTLYEPLHVVTYFAPSARQAFEQAGLRGFWRGYFAGRAAPLGAADAPLVIATFASFAPPFVRRALPAVWELITPERALAVREAGAVAALRDLLGAGDGLGATAAVRAAADGLHNVTKNLNGAGRPLGGPNAALPVPADDVARLWRAATVLREHRGDGHIAALVAAGLDGCEALALRVAVDEAARDEAARDEGARDEGARDEGAGPVATGPVLSRAQLQAVRGWTDEEWDAAAARLADRGWLDRAGAATADGRAAHRSIEDATDQAAARPWAGLAADDVAELAGRLAPMAAACAAVVPYPNPVGVPRPGAAVPGPGATA